MAGLLERLRTEAILVADGAWGSELIERGLDVTREPADVWNLRHRAIVADLAEQYARYADILSTNTFGANRARLAGFGLERKLHKINARGVAIAKQAVQKEREGRPSPLIAGSIGPVRGPGNTSLDDSALFSIFYEQAAILAGAGVTFILLETMTDLAEARVAVRAAKAACPLEVVCSFAFRELSPAHFQTWSGDGVETALGGALEEGADLVGANCIPADASILPLINSMRRFVGERPLWLKPNAGQPTKNEAPALAPAKDISEKISRVLNRFAEAWYEAQWGPGVHENVMNYPCRLYDAPLNYIIDALGTGIIGGCCGASPIDILMIHRELKHRAGLR